MNKNRVLVDMDGVLALFDQGIIDRWNERNGTNITRADVNIWHMEEVLKNDRYGLSSVGLIDMWMTEPDFFATLPVMPGAIEGFNYLRQEFKEVFIVSSIGHVYKNIYDGKRRWLEKYLPDFPRDNFFAVSRKHFIKADCLIDDGSHNIKSWVDDGGFAIVFDAPYNQDVQESHNCVRLKGWDGIVTWYEGLKKIEDILDESRREWARKNPWIYTKPRGHY